jgi:type IV pilus assembly protein PilB
MSVRVRLGELLVSSHIITREQLETVLAAQQGDGRRLGKLLVERGLVTETQLTQILSQQLSVPWVSLYHIDFSRQLLDLVPEELAEQHCLIPIFVRRVRGLGETLYVAMDDPTHEAAVQAVADFAGLPVRTMIAPPSDIRSAIRAYYPGGAEQGEMLGDDDVAHAPSFEPPAPVRRAASVKPVPPEPAVEALPPAAPTPTFSATEAEPFVITPDPPKIDPSTIPPGDVSSDEPPPDSSPTIEAREISMPAPARRPQRRMITLTLLDGTKVNLPARSSRPPKEKDQAQKDEAKSERRDPDESGGALTARDLVAALRAVTHGADASEILGDEVRWEPLFAALLEVLLKKHIIADWEFVEEFRKI